MSRLANRARMTTATTGTGPVTLGVATAGFQTFAAALGASAANVPYAIAGGAVPAKAGLNLQAFVQLVDAMRAGAVPA